MAAKSKSGSRKGSTGSGRSAKMEQVFYVSLVAAIIGAVGVVYGIMALMAAGGSTMFAGMGLTTDAYSSAALTGMGLVMIVQSVVGAVSGLLGIRASNSAFPDDGKPFILFSGAALILSVAGLVAGGSSSFVAILVEGLCIYEAWVVLHLPRPKAKKSKSRR